MVASNGVVWLVYGVLVGHPLLGAAGLLQLPCSMIVIARPLRDRGDAEVDAGAETLGPASDGP